MELADDLSKWLGRSGMPLLASLKLYAVMLMMIIIILLSKNV